MLTHQEILDERKLIRKTIPPKVKVENNLYTPSLLEACSGKAVSLLDLVKLYYK